MKPSIGSGDIPPATGCVIDDFEPGRQFDPALLETLRAEGRWVTVVEGSAVRQDLRVR